MYKWDALAGDADVPPTGDGFRGFRISHIVDTPASVETLLGKASAAGGKALPGAYFSDPDGYLWKIASRA
jgi:uncharacterized protein